MPAVTPELSPVDLSVALYDRYESLAEVKHYYGLLAIYSLCRIAELADDGALLDRCRGILERFPNQIDHPPYNFPSYRIGGIPRAYMLYRGHMTDEMTRRYVQHYAEEMMLAARDRDGLMSMPRCPKKEQVWIDVAMAVTPYLLFAGLGLNEPHYIDEAAKQAFLHYQVFRNPDNGLLHQCRGFVGPRQLSTDHWGRGNGWGYIALTELVQHLPADSPHLAEAQRMFVELSDALLPHPSERGLWRQEVPDPNAWEEASATGLILYGYGVGMRLGLLAPDRFGPAFDQSLAGLIEHGVGQDYQTHLCCPGCLCPGEGTRKGTPAAYIEDKQPVDDDGHSFAPIILALGEQLRAGER